MPGGGGDGGQAAQSCRPWGPHLGALLLTGHTRMERENTECSAEGALVGLEPLRLWHLLCLKIVSKKQLRQPVSWEPL